ncbi:MAG: rRNA maturation RNase YbeY [Lachnospiraceae bacterium]|nr:rRNA maturation RNase YbeY [Lachnospiraceae bacterium]
MTILLEEETDQAKKLDFDYRSLLEQIVPAVLATEGFPDSIQLSVTFVDEAVIQEINRNFREMDAPTDVLSFPMLHFSGGGGFDHLVQESADRDPETGELLLGDIVLCIPKVFAQASEYGHSEKREYAFLLVHSLLHLMGYDHIEDADRDVMEDRQRSVMEQLQIGRD